MNFKKTWKRFWTLSRASEGFTLVELIVVIAILAILAGIAVPAYSGYIKKANKAADLQLLGAVNTAFAAAVLENGRDVNDVQNASITRAATRARAATEETSWTVGGATVAFYSGKTPANFDVNEFSAAFMRYFGNSNATFKAIKYAELDYVPGVGFVDVTSSSAHTSASYNGTTLYLSQSDVNALTGSTFITANGLGAAGLLEQVGEVADFAQGLMNSDDPNAFADIMGGQPYLQYLANTLGVQNTAGMDVEQLNDAIGTRMEELNFTQDQAMGAMTNGAILYAAQNTSGMTTSDVTALLGSGNGKSNIVSTLSSGNSGEALAQAAMAYGMYTAYAYANDPGDGSLINNTSDPVNVMNHLGDEGFLSYINSNPQATTDAEGYLAALNMINTSVDSSSDAAIDVLQSGFNNTDMVALLQGLTTSQQ